MNKDKQRIKIAEACGWTGPYASREWSRGTGYEGEDEYMHDAATSPDGERCELPDYLNDLNAMHEAEKVLTYKVAERGEISQRSLYIQILAGIMAGPRDHLGDGPPICFSDTAFATAAQRAEAFLKTLKLWEK